MEQKIDEAVIVPYDCEKCFDTGIISGTADLDGERILIAKLCDCIKENLNKKDEE